MLEERIAALEGKIDNLDLPMTTVHGDVGFGNVLHTARGPLWNDWEDTHRAPLAWDLATLITPATVLGTDRDRAEAALAAYGPLPDRSLIDLLVRARAVQVAVWMIHLVSFHPPLIDRLEAWMAWLGSDGSARG